MKNYFTVEIFSMLFYILIMTPNDIIKILMLKEGQFLTCLRKFYQPNIRIHRLLEKIYNFSNEILTFKLCSFCTD